MKVKILLAIGSLTHFVRFYIIFNKIAAVTYDLFGRITYIV